MVLVGTSAALLDHTCVNLLEFSVLVSLSVSNGEFKCGAGSTKESPLEAAGVGVQTASFDGEKFVLVILSGSVVGVKLDLAHASWHAWLLDKTDLGS